MDPKSKFSNSQRGVHHCRDCELGRTEVARHCVSEFMREGGKGAELGGKMNMLGTVTVA